MQGFPFFRSFQGGFQARPAPGGAFAVLLTCVLPCAADPVFTVQAAFYDQPIAAFGGEFGARKPGACGYSASVPGPTGRPFDVITGMVRDTLGYSREARKKLPAPGAVNCNSDSLAEWFDPRHASASVCRDLAFVPVKDSLTGATDWGFKRDFFFPIDDLAPAGQLEGPGPGWDSIPDVTLPPGYAGVHNFNWCMEINAQFQYKGGETFRFGGDDDVWVFVDNHLIVDLGGIHGTSYHPPVAMDSLPFLAGRRGETFDFDMYFCERRPAGSTIDMVTDLALRPAPFLDLDVALADGSLPDPRLPIVGKTRLCAKPDYGSGDACGNFRPAPKDPFHPATWTLDGRVIARDSACIDLDPGALPANRRIVLAAKAEGKTSRMGLQVLRHNAPLAAALKGAGRLQAVSLRLAPGDSLYAPLQARFAFAGAWRTLDSRDAAYAAAENTLTWNLAPADWGNFGVTGPAADSLIVSQTVLGFPFAFAVKPADSISPAVTGAAWLPGRDGALRLELKPSETLAAPFPPGLQGLLFKGRNGPAQPPSADAAPAFDSLGNLDITFPASYPGDFRGVDSVSFSAAAADPAGNAARPLFFPLAPLDWSAVPAEIASVSLEENPALGKPFAPAPAAPALVHLDAAGNPLRDEAGSASVAAAGGPVLVVRSAEPLDRIEFKVFSNLGAYVGSAAYAFTGEEWDRLRAQAQGDTCTLRLRWYPVSRGSEIGTGAYILKGSALTRAGWSQDASGHWIRRLPRRKWIGPLRFGYLRR